jgi:hypothetical protein
MRVVACRYHIEASAGWQNHSRAQVEVFVSRSVAPLFFLLHTFANCHPFPNSWPFANIHPHSISPPPPSHHHHHLSLSLSLPIFTSSPHLHTVLAVPEPVAPCHRTCDSMDPVAPSHRKLGLRHSPRSGTHPEAGQSRALLSR